MKQETFTDMEYNCRKKKTKREEFLEIMDEIIPWEEWVDIIAPYYPQGRRGRPPMGIEKMLRMYLLQIWFHLSDPATEDAIYDSYPTSLQLYILQVDHIGNEVFMLPDRKTMEVVIIILTALLAVAKAISEMDEPPESTTQTE